MASTTNQTVPPQLPHGELQSLFENIWFIQGQIKMPMKLPAKISRSMTVYKNRTNDELTLINSMRLSKDGLAKLQSLGKIANVIRVGAFHGRDDLFYRNEFNAKIYAFEGQTYSRSMEAPSDVNEGFMQPDVRVSQASDLPIPNCDVKIFASSTPPEAAVLINEHNGILVTADSLQNTPKPDRFVNFPMKIMMKKFGFWKAHNVGPGWVQFAKPALADIRSVMELDFEHVLPGHGEAVIGDAKNKFRPVVESEIKGCHE